ncbi:MAG: diguanylate cyclase, partial [Deltaproteobacteria bacterium]|nr:diguanylate cyclase [Deltaproteobacteria bacterium]
AYTFYVAVVVGGLVWFVRSQQRKVDRKHQEWVREKEIGEKLRQADRLKDEFLANTSHELRTPLHGIIGIAESLVDGVTGELAGATRRNLSMIVSSGRRLEGLVDDILDFSQLKNRALTLSRRPVDLRSLTDVILTLSRPLVKQRAVELVNEVPEDLPMADADEDRLQQIMHNLVGNAAKFTEQGAVRVSAVKRDGMLAVSVTDTGIGIEPANRQRIFEAFEQGEGDTTRVYGGTGLGLTVARQLVELHGGSIEVSSTPGEGSAFTFTLPVASGPATPDVQSTRVPKVRILESVSESGELIPPPRSVSGSGAQACSRLLVVDDEPVNRQVLINQLSLHPYEIIQASGGEEALEALERAQPDLVLLDIMMPRMSGYEVCRRLRATRSASQMPVIYLTAKDRTKDLVEAFQTGGNDYLTKPITKEELLLRVKIHLELLDVNRNLERKVAERTGDLSRANAELERLASLDGLTQIPNRRLFDQTLARTWADHRRRGAELAVILSDTDHFKSYNDAKGHQQGDAALVAMARALQRSLQRVTDFAARYGGEEFVAILPDTAASEAAAIGERMRQAVLGLKLEYEDSEVSRYLTLSVGVASTVPPRTGEAATLVEKADRALYQAKESGRNRVIVAGD